MQGVERLMVEVQSEAIDEIAYDDRQSVLFVRFSHGGWYSYFGVSAGTFEEFIAAQSHGRFFHEQIRDRYFFRRGR